MRLDLVDDLVHLGPRGVISLAVPFCAICRYATGLNDFRVVGLLLTIKGLPELSLPQLPQVGDDVSTSAEGLSGIL